MPKKKSTFNEECYEILKKIPKGKVTTYKAIAQELKTKAYRAIGQAMKNNPYAPLVPCHRVIKANGEIGGFARGTQEKIKLLEKEGVIITKGKINLQEFAYFFSNKI